MKKILTAVMLCVLVFAACGCQTAKGATTGMALTAKGAVDDTVGLFGAIMKLDQWMRDNMW